MIEGFVMVILALLIVGQLIERHLFAQTMLRQLNDCMKVAMSRSMNDYLAATASKSPNDKPTAETDEVLLETVDDKTFDQFIKKQVS